MNLKIDANEAAELCSRIKKGRCIARKHHACHQATGSACSPRAIQREYRPKSKTI